VDSNTSFGIIHILSTLIEIIDIYPIIAHLILSAIIDGKAKIEAKKK